MRSTSLALPLGILLSLTATAAFARGPLTIGTQTPGEFSEVRTEIEDKIPPYLEESQCGGWNTDVSVEGKIASATGVPGRKHKWNGAILGGMGTRIDDNANSNTNDDFSYPTTAKGLTTSCWSDLDQALKFVWRIRGPRPGEIQNVGIWFDHPYFSDPPCRWRIDKEGAFLEAAPDQPLKDDNPLTADKYKYKEYDFDFRNRQNPETCTMMCPYLNSFQYSDCKEIGVAVDPDGNEYLVCNQWGIKFLCTDQWTDGNNESCNPAGPPTQYPNSTSCQGEACRCNGPGCTTTPNGDIYYSFYRRYFGTYSRSQVPKDEGEDKASNFADVACYGYYNEFDPKTQQTHSPDRRCVINMDVKDMRETQKGKGEFGQNSSFPDIDPSQDANQRDNGDFDAEEDLWYQKLGRSFSLLNEKIFEDEMNKDLSQVYLNIDRLDRADLKATVQLTTEKPLAKSNDIRAFDDTGKERVVTGWWQKQEQEVAELVHRPVVRLLLPTGWAFGADPDDPLFNDKRVQFKTGEAGRIERIEFQIDADEDILGMALAYIERSLLLHVREEPVPVLVPLGSPTEFRARAQAWCSWHMTETGEKDCSGLPSDVKDLMTSLEEYADEIEKVRELRSELAMYAGKILKLQRDLTKPISEWLGLNIDKYKEILEEQQTIRSMVEGEWRTAQQNMNDLHDDKNQPWCMNQRFTNPVFSFLDEWMPSREEDGKMSGDRMPNLTVERPEDLIIDLSTIAYMTGSIVLPVLQPIQIRITDIPSPPNIEAAKTLPPMPNIDDIQTRVRMTADLLPDPPTNSPSPAPLDIAPLGTAKINEYRNTLSQISGKTQEMKDAYEKFWKSLSPLRPEDDSSDRNDIPEMKRQLDCKYWDVQPCTNVEMDLMERFVRIGSRPDVQLIDDYLSIGYPRGFGAACNPEDDNCIPTHPEGMPPGSKWEVIGPRTQQEFIDDLRRSVRELTLPDPVGTIDPDDMPPYDADINHLLPAHDVPDSIDLSPASSSSSSSS